MPSKKERPAPLSDGVFSAKLQQQQEKSEDNVRDIPVHNTFIQFASEPEGDAAGKRTLCTAPAWVGPSMESVMRSATQSMVQTVPVQPSEDPELDLPYVPNGAGPAGGIQPIGTSSSSATSQKQPTASPQKVPVMRYSLSASSARAAGLTGNDADEAEGEGAVDDDEADEDVQGLVSATIRQGDEEARAAAEAGDLPSMGSAKHAEGLCKRCCFFPKGRCLNGLNCEFCHFEHEKRKRKKKKKGAKRDENDDDSDDDDDDDDENEQQQGQQPPKPRKAPDAAARVPEVPSGLLPTALPPHPPVGPPNLGPVPTEPPPTAPPPRRQDGQLESGQLSAEASEFHPGYIQASLAEPYYGAAAYEAQLQAQAAHAAQAAHVAQAHATHAAHVAHAAAAAQYGAYPYGGVPFPPPQPPAYQQPYHPGYQPVSPPGYGVPPHVGLPPVSAAQAAAAAAVGKGGALPPPR